MILVLEKGISPRARRQVELALKRDGYAFSVLPGFERRILSVRDRPGHDASVLPALPGVERIESASSAFKLVGRDAHRADTVVQVRDVAIGGQRLAVIAGPCAIESGEQALSIAREVRRYGATLFRGGAFKPRSSPYSFQGLGEAGLKILAEVRAATGLPVVSEITAPEQSDLMARYVDVLQVGARNMQNFELLKCVGRLRVPVLLKRGLAATIEEWLMSAEYVLAGGNSRVILCERGIRTFEPYTRNTLDLSAIPVVRRLTHLPILIDPSHATGIREKVSPMARAAVAAGADGLMIEVHNAPEKAMSDGAQSLLPEQFGQLMRDIYVIAPVVGKQVDFDYLDKAGRTVGRAAKRRKGQADVAFVGSAGSFEHKACGQYFGGRVKTLGVRTRRAVFEAVAEGAAEFGIVPLENSLTGSVHANYELLLEHELRIVGELTLRLEYHLIGAPGQKLSRVRRVLSHPHIFDQCRGYVERQQWELVPTEDEATAVRMLKRRNRRTEAAIAGRAAAELHKMAVLASGIETNPRNYTRYALVSVVPASRRRKGHGKAAKPCKSSLIYSTPNRAGALHDTLRVFSRNGVNLVKLESRPITGKPWEYMFYVDVEADLDSEPMRPVMKALRAKTDFLRVLGCY